MGIISTFSNHILLVEVVDILTSFFYFKNILPFKIFVGFQWLLFHWLLDKILFLLIVISLIVTCSLFLWSNSQHSHLHWFICWLSIVDFFPSLLYSLSADIFVVCLIYFTGCNLHVFRSLSLLLIICIHTFSSWRRIKTYNKPNQTKLNVYILKYISVFYLYKIYLWQLPMNINYLITWL